MWLIFFLAASLFLTPIPALLFSLLFPGEKRKNDETAVDHLAEASGAIWKQLSVFQHIELGLKKNPHRPAVICTFQPPNFLNDLVGSAVGNNSEGRNVAPQQSLWQRQQRQQHDNLPSPHRYGERDVRLWGQNTEQTETVHSPLCLTLSYTQLHHTALKIALGLLENGAQDNTTMLMLIPNGGEYALLLWACVLLRITYVSLDPAMLEISGFSALKHRLATLKPQIVVAPNEYSGKALDVAICELQLPQPIRVCLSPSQTASQIHGWRSLANVLADAKTSSVDQHSLVAAARYDNPKRVHSIMFTSGTSGLPKGCPMRVGGMSHVLHSQSWLVDTEAGAVALQQPHNSRGIAPAQTLQTWRAGGAVVMTGQEFNVVAAAEAIRQLGATFMVLTPPMVHEMAVELAVRPFDASSIRKIQIGGDAVTKGILSRCAGLFPQAQICVNHGMTEGGGSFVWPFIGTPTSQIPFFGELCPVGMVAPGSVIRLWNLEKKCVANKGELGELHVASGSLILHYLGGRSEESFYEDERGRWFNTGDIALMDKTGLVFILGREKDMIKRAGKAIMPAPIESSIEAYTGTQTILLPAPHHVLGAEPFAVLASFNGKTKVQIKDHVRTVLGRDYALGGVASLKELGMVDFPLNSTRKIVKSEIQMALLKYIKRISKETGRR